MKKNNYFEEFERIGHDWQKKHTAHEKLKNQIIATKGWDSPELKTLYAEEEQMKFPFPEGAQKAYRAWKFCDQDELIFDDYVWQKEVHDFIDTLRKAGLHSFVITNQSTALMENLHWFAAEGCNMQGLCTITRKDHRWGEENEETILGIRFEL